VSALKFSCDIFVFQLNQCTSVGKEYKILMVDSFNSLELIMQRDRSSKTKKKLCSQLKIENRSTGWSTGHAQNVHKELWLTIQSITQKKAAAGESISQPGGRLIETVRSY